MNLRIRFSQPLGQSLRMICVVAGIASLLFSFTGCGKSKDEVKKEDEQGKQANEAAMQRMTQEQAGKQSQNGGNGK